MLGLPKSTEITKPLPKKAIFDKYKPSPADRKLFDEQINRLTIIGEISQHTVPIQAGSSMAAFYVVLVVLKSEFCNRKNIQLLSKLIDQRMLFVLQYRDAARLAVYRAGSVIVSDSKPLAEWSLHLSGLDIGAVWENVIAQIAGIVVPVGAELDATILEAERQEKLSIRIGTLENKALSERQPRRKWELVEEIRKLRAELGGTTNEKH